MSVYVYMYLERMKNESIKKYEVICMHISRIS